MNDPSPVNRNVPLNVIAQGRPLKDVLEEYMRIFMYAKKAVTKPGKGEEDVFADTLKAAAYRLYLLGVEDGMKKKKEDTIK